MIAYPEFNPIALEIGPLKIHWYGLMYVAAFALLWLLGKYRIKKGMVRLTVSEFEDLIFYGVMGVVLGGRLGYVLFYQPGYYFSNPLHIFSVWDGGMSFHGGLIGVLVVLYLFAHKKGMTFFEVADFIAPLVPLGLAMGRIGNFINGELWGRPSDLPWAMVFPQGGPIARHPSQLYEMLAEGVILFAVVWIFSSKKRWVGQTSGVFMAGYGLARFLVEYTREPDSFLGTLSLGLSMGQWLSLPMIVLGVLIFIWATKRSLPPSTV